MDLLGCGAIVSLLAIQLNARLAGAGAFAKPQAVQRQQLQLNTWAQHRGCPGKEQFGAQNLVVHTRANHSLLRVHNHMRVTSKNRSCHNFDYDRIIKEE